MSRSVLVTGGSRGIGLAIADRFAANGDRVAVTYRSGQAPTDHFGVRCDITSSEDVDAAFSQIEEKHGPVEVLVANAGITRDQLLIRLAEDDFYAVLDTNLTGAFRVAKRASRAMLRARNGRVIFIASAVALRGEAGQANYAASKAGLIGFARSMTQELASRNITFNVVSPGLTDTDMVQQLTEEQRESMIAQIPARRMAQPHEIAAAVHFLASPEAAYINGAVLPVSGGAGLGH
ncbi:3-oxoacyl-ACP reductase FabG [Streptomyces sp. NPDC059009]|uniref:3-oxoacyl-ACP reductase FabG n=1 Tax=Streptomyces sp. NPDC059009 TaxID=3346694 RepID=UPI0036AC754E